jgi:hypothetical protein
MNDFEQKFTRLKQKITDLDMPIPGTLHVQYRKCGKANCRCHEAQEYMHGPYYLWYRKVDGKLKTTVINAEDAELYRQWIVNRQHLESITNEMLQLGEQCVAKKTPAGNSKKT